RGRTARGAVRPLVLDRDHYRDGDFISRHAVTITADRHQGPVHHGRPTSSRISWARNLAPAILAPGWLIRVHVLVLVRERRRLLDVDVYAYAYEYVYEDTLAAWRNMLHKPHVIPLRIAFRFGVTRNADGVGAIDQQSFGNAHPGLAPPRTGAAGSDQRHGAAVAIDLDDVSRRARVIVACDHDGVARR